MYSKPFKRRLEYPQILYLSQNSETTVSSRTHLHVDNNNFMIQRLETQ